MRKGDCLGEYSSLVYDAKVEITHNKLKVRVIFHYIQLCLVQDKPSRRSFVEITQYLVNYRSTGASSHRNCLSESN